MTFDEQEGDDRHGVVEALLDKILSLGVDGLGLFDIERGSRHRDTNPSLR